jgi:tetratricopeptide (TPR) repeat protein
LNDPSEPNLKKALAEFEHAIQLDPRFGSAFAGLAFVYTWEAWGGIAGGIDVSFPPIIAAVKGKAAAEKALQLDNTLAEAHCALGFALENFFDWAGAESELRLAIALNPSYAYAHDQYGIMLAQLGRLDQALAENMRAAELDPLSPETHLYWAVTLVWQGNYQAAMEQCRKALDLDPNSAHWSVGWMNLQTGQFSQAIPELQKAYAIESTGSAAGYLGYAYAASGDRTRATGVLKELNQQSSRGFISPFWPAIIYLGLGDRQRGLEGLEKAYEAHDPWVMQLKMDRVFNPLRSDPRFIQLLRELRLDK